jgi:hypothetical protein
LAVHPGPNPPGPATVTGGSGDVAVLQFVMEAGASEDITVEEIRLQAYGTGDDLRHILSVRLYRDSDEDGQRGPSDQRISGFEFYASDDGIATIPLGETVPAGRRRVYVAVYDFAPKLPRGSSFETRIASAHEVRAFGDTSGGPARVQGPPVVGEEFLTRRTRPGGGGGGCATVTGPASPLDGLPWLFPPLILFLLGVRSRNLPFRVHHTRLPPRILLRLGTKVWPRSDQG